MNQYPKSVFFVTSLLLMSISITGTTSATTDVSQRLTSQLGDGIWINDTLEINGSTTLPPQNADWVLYDVTNPSVSYTHLTLPPICSV